MCSWGDHNYPHQVVCYCCSLGAVGLRHSQWQGMAADCQKPSSARQHNLMADVLPPGVVYATKPHAEVLGVARLLDERNRLEAVINFGPVPGTRQRMLARADAVCGEVYQLPKAAHLQVGGSDRSSLSPAGVHVTTTAIIGV